MRLSGKKGLLAGALFLTAVGCGTSDAQTQVSGTLPQSPAPQAETQSAPDGFFERLGAFYTADWHPAPPAPDAAAAPPAPRRGLPSPLDSPPFPSSDWSYGGSPTIGEADGNSYPLVAAINENKTRTKIYGWLAPNVNGSTSGKSNSPEANDLYPNRLELGQAVLYIERLPDSVQRDHVDVGFHLTALYGTDYRYTVNKGYGLSQLAVDHRQYGFDPALEYLDIYFPRVALGMNLRVGRFISIPGIEAQLTPNNYMLSHSLLYSVDPFTDTGVLATIQLTSQWLVQVGVSAGHDVAPWTVDAKPALITCLSYTTRTVNDNYYLCANGINDGKYAYNNLQQYDGTWYHKFSPKWHIASEAYVMYERDVPSIYGTIVPEPNSNGAVCRQGLQTCFAPEWAIDNYINRELNAHNFLSLRNDFLNDKKGQRTGVNSKYTETTFTLSHWIGTTVQMRPEVRFDHSWDRAGYDLGKKQNQFTVASDVIFHF